MSANFTQALAGTHLYPVTNREISGLSHAEQVQRLCDAGAKLIQLREKNDTPAMFYPDAESALQVARSRGAKIIINDRVDIALALKADGVHLGQDDLPPEAARRILGPEALIGFSTHNLDQAKRAATMPVAYVAIGPVFPTATKQSQNPAVGLEGLRILRAALGALPIVAIGGITADNMSAVLAAGADAAAVISDLWTPREAFSTKIQRLITTGADPTQR